MPKGKKKHKPQRPPLSKLNKLLYGVLFVLGIVLIMGICVLFNMWQQQLGKVNGAIAVNSTASLLLIIIPLFPASVIGVVLFEIGYQGRIPIIGPRPKNPSPPRKRRINATGALLIAIAVFSGLVLLFLRSVRCITVLKSTKPTLIHMLCSGDLGRAVP